MTYLLFVWTPTGYLLREQDGEPPKPGDRVEPTRSTSRSSSSASRPLPGDDRVCAFAQG